MRLNECRELRLPESHMKHFILTRPARWLVGSDSLASLDSPGRTDFPHWDRSRSGHIPTANRTLVSTPFPGRWSRFHRYDLTNNKVFGRYGWAGHLRSCPSSLQRRSPYGPELARQRNGAFQGSTTTNHLVVKFEVSLPWSNVSSAISKLGLTEVPVVS